jgi:hypothetical protein
VLVEANLFQCRCTAIALSFHLPWIMFQSIVSSQSSHAVCGNNAIVPIVLGGAESIHADSTGG